MEIAIKIEQLAKKYKGKTKNRYNPLAEMVERHALGVFSYFKRGKTKPVDALVDLNLEVKIGDIYGFIGPNGAGKTTTIKILTGLISPTAGSATVMGYPAGTVESKKQVGFLSEVSYYYPFMEVGTLLDFYCSFFEIPRAQRKKKIAEVLEMVNLQDKIYARMGELSKGMQQRFGIAQAIIADPPLLILDELTSGLDPIAQKEVKDVVLKLKQRGITIFFSSHMMTEVELICDKIGIIYNGQMLKSANLDDFIKEESGALTRMVVKAENQEVLDFLKEKNLQINQQKTDVVSFILPENDAPLMLDTLREKKIPIMEMTPHRYSLEDAFFKLIKEAK